MATSLTCQAVGSQAFGERAWTSMIMPTSPRNRSAADL